MTLFFTIGIVHFLAVVSPGPDFIMVIKNTLQGGKKSGFFTSAGITLALLVHISYCALGIGLLISQSILAFNILKILGGLYLIYLGYKSFLAKPSKIEITEEKPVQNSAKKAFISGFFCNVLNPKATLYFVSLFALFLPADISQNLLIFISFEIMLITFIWFSFLTLFFAHEKVRSGFLTLEGIINKFLGGVLIFFGVKILTSAQK